MNTKKDITNTTLSNLFDKIDKLRKTNSSTIINSTSNNNIGLSFHKVIPNNDNDISTNGDSNDEIYRINVTSLNESKQVQQDETKQEVGIEHCLKKDETCDDLTNIVKSNMEDSLKYDCKKLNNSENEKKEKKLENKSKTDGYILSLRYKMIFISIVLYFIIFKIQSMFLFGLILGISIVFTFAYIAKKLNNRSYVETIEPSLLSYSKKAIIKKIDDTETDGVYKGWMNELREKYSPETYYLNKTRSVYVSLDVNSSLLRLQTTNLQHIPKRAIYNESIAIPAFNEQKLYYVKDCEISILPVELVRKRYWSKKYPILLKNVKLIQSHSKENDVKEQKNEKQIEQEQIILFARCDREKEDWFNLFVKASSNDVSESVKKVKKSQNNLSKPELATTLNDSDDKNANLTTMLFLNGFLSRLFVDFFQDKTFSCKIKEKVQKKLNTIKLPYFMEELLINEINLGTSLPEILQVNDLYENRKGLWALLDLDYNGTVKMSLETKLNLMSFKQSKSNDNLPKDNKRTRYLGMLHSDEEDSPESSGDEYIHKGENEDDKFIESPNKSKRFLNIVNKITASTYFQKATENKYVKMAFENVSNTPLILNVEVKKINGTLILNIPPYPSDRLWYGFIDNPTFILTVTPQVGVKEVSYASVTEWIADKLKMEFQKVLVFPNMDDFYIPILKSEISKSHVVDS